MPTLTASDIRRLRLANHWLARRPDATASEVVTHLGALQSQEIWSGLWSIGARSAALDIDAVHQACERAEILRTWPLRNTVHFIRAADTRWMLEIASDVAFKGVERRRATIGLSEADALAACELLRDALVEPTPRVDCVALLTDAGVLTDSRHAYHLLWFAAQHGAIVIGPQRGSIQTFVRLDAWVPPESAREPDEPLAELAVRYFTSHGPAPLVDLKRWTGLTMGAIRQAVALAGDRLEEVSTEFGPMLMASEQAANLADGPVAAPEPDRAVQLLSGFDEYVLGYGDRSAIMEPDQFALVVPGNNGMFRPTIIDDGTVIGVWTRKVKRTRVDILPEPFAPLTKRQRQGVRRAADNYGAFLGLEARVVDA